MWQESALGSFGESMCYQPDGNSKRAKVTDARPLSVCNMDSTPSNCKKYIWTENVGGGDFLVYYDGIITLKRRTLREVTARAAAAQCDLLNHHHRVSHVSYLQRPPYYLYSLYY